MEASLTCAVCLSLFEEPVTLPVCSHNFCRPCVVEYLSQTRSAAAPGTAAAPTASSRQPPQAPPTRTYNQPPVEPRQGPGRASRYGGGGGSLTVSCPLCRKLCPLPLNGGAAALPINTTLAEVVKLFKAANAAPKPSQELTEEEASAALVPRLAALGASCEKHPGRSLQLYCRMCRRGGCGQCVSEEHRGIFHFVNLIDVVYQDEKLAFFSNLKKLRELHLQLMKETEMYSRDIEAELQSEEKAIKTEFEKVCKALEAKKNQLLEDLESQKKRKIKECLIWKRMKEVHKKTVENILSDCEKLLDECDPHRFLEVACNLNQRMQTQLDLMQIASSNKNQAEYKQKEMDTTSIINEILALHLNAANLDAIKDGSFGDSEQKDKRNQPDMFYSVAGERFMSISASTEFKSMSHEELRYNYYMKRQMRSGGLRKCMSSGKGRYILQPKFQYLKSMTAAVAPPLCSEAKSQAKVKKQTLRKQSVTETNFSDSFAFTFKRREFNVPSSKNYSNCYTRERLLEKLDRFSKATDVSLVHEVNLPSNTQLSSAVYSDSSQSATPSIGTSNPPSSAPVLEHLAPPITSSLNVTVPTASMDSNIRNSINGYNSSKSIVASPSNYIAADTTTITTTTTIYNSALSAAVVEKPAFCTFSSSSDSCCLQAPKLSSPGQNFYPFFLTVQKTGQESTTVSFSKDNLECNWLVSSTFAPGKPVIDKSGFINNLVCQSSSSAFDKIDPSKKQSQNLSSSHSSSTPCLFAFKGILKNSCDILKSSNERAEISEGNSVVSKSVSWKDAPPFQEFENVMSHSSSCMVKCPKSDIDGQQNEASSVAATNTLVSKNLTEQDRRSFHVLPNGARCILNSDTDTDDLSQASSSSDCSSASEYFSITEDKILSCLK